MLSLLYKGVCGLDNSITYSLGKAYDSHLNSTPPAKHPNLHQHPANSAKLIIASVIFAEPFENRIVRVETQLQFALLICSR